ncbi:MAG TPA: DUF1365 domain-containing protein [Spongiibacteraceae bacterium]|nr:DUF1365 domain-containing protein [Spongiibacteraceae bacterium]HUH38062.1 DUF1365 domain-containing protein [Spongiibacteraceae bacterium]
MSLSSAIYVGTVRHRRFAPRSHEFRYRVFMMYIDLDELPALFDGVPLWSASRPALAWFRRADYFGDPARPLADCVREAVAEAAGDPPRGPIRMLTNLRYFGYCKNPVTFYYCFDSAGERVVNVLAEVNNTPWNERHHYVLPGEDAARHILASFDKAMHVSPFNALAMQYTWRGNRPQERLAVHMQNLDAGVCVTDATLALRRRTITRGSLLGVLLGFPLMTVKVIAAIYWQALRLWLKGVPVHDHPGRADGSNAAPDSIDNDGASGRRGKRN